MLIILNSGDCFSYCNKFILKETSFEITDDRNFADSIFLTAAQLFVLVSLNYQLELEIYRMN